MATTSHIAFFLFLFLSLLSLSTSHNITTILSAFPEYSQYNSFLSQTKLADEINSRQTITVLVLTNSAMSSLVGNHPLSVIKNSLSILVLLDYYDSIKLHDISKGTTFATTLYQTTGNAQGNLGFVNITNFKDGKVRFGSASPGSKLDSSFTKSIKQIPYTISVLEITSPIMAPGILTAPAPSVSTLNITDLLDKSGCKTFSSLIIGSGVLKIYQSAINKGLTLFAPKDEAFEAPGLPDLSKLTNDEVIKILKYHALSGYNPIGTLKTSKDLISTLASNGGDYELKVKVAGDSVTLDTGFDKSRVSGTVIDSTPLCIFTVDDVLLPIELFGQSPSPAPSPVSLSPSPSPAPEIDSAPAPAPEIASAPSPDIASGPAPAFDIGSGPAPAFDIASGPAPGVASKSALPSNLAPGGAPSNSPGSGSGTGTTGHGSDDVRAPALLKTLITVSGAILVWGLC